MCVCLFTVCVSVCVHVCMFLCVCVCVCVCLFSVCVYLCEWVSVREVLTEETYSPVELTPALSSSGPSCMGTAARLCTTHPQFTHATLFPHLCVGSNITTPFVSICSKGSSFRRGWCTLPLNSSPGWCCCDSWNPGEILPKKTDEFLRANRVRARSVDGGSIQIQCGSGT